MQLRSGCWYGPPLPLHTHTLTQVAPGCSWPLCDDSPAAAAADSDRYATGGYGERSGLVQRQLPWSDSI